MKITSSLLAAFILAITGMANSATVGNFNFTETLVYVGLPNVYGDGAGFAVLDDSGTLTMDVTATTTFFSLYYFTESGTMIFSGNWDGTTFAPTSGTSSTTACVSDISPCPSSLPTPMLPLDPSISMAGPLTKEGGTFNFTESGNLITYVFTPTAVPIPATAWLFGSSLMGLMGFARKRKSI